MIRIIIYNNYLLLLDVWMMKIKIYAYTIDIFISQGHINTNNKIIR